MDEALLVSPRAAARILGIGRDYLYGLLRSGELRSLRVGRKRLIPRFELEDFVRRQLAAEASK
jgi:excisionase family DNA binding protein